MSQRQEHETYYPTWADPFDVVRAERQGMQPILREGESWKLCPYDEQPFGRCTDGVWNELACDCF